MEKLKEMQKSVDKAMDAIKHPTEETVISGDTTKDGKDDVFNVDTTGDGYTDVMMWDTTADGKPDYAMLDTTGDHRVDTCVDLDDTGKVVPEK